MYYTRKTHVGGMVVKLNEPDCCSACDMGLSQLDGRGTPIPALCFRRRFGLNSSQFYGSSLHTNTHSYSPHQCRNSIIFSIAAIPYHLSRVPVTTPLRVCRSFLATRCQSVSKGSEKVFLRDTEQKPTTSGSSGMIFPNKRTD